MLQTKKCEVIALVFKLSNQCGIVFQEMTKIIIASKESDINIALLTFSGLLFNTKPKKRVVKEHSKIRTSNTGGDKKNETRSDICLPSL